MACLASTRVRIASGPIVAGDLGIEEEGLGDRTGIGQAGGLDHHLVEGDLPGAPPRGEIGQGRPQVVADAAAQAAVAELDDLLLAAGDDDLAVDVLLAELVLDDGDLPPVSLGEDAAQQGGFAGPEEAGEDGGGDQRLSHAQPVTHDGVAAEHLALLGGADSVDVGLARAGRLVGRGEGDLLVIAVHGVAVRPPGPVG